MKPNSVYIFIYLFLQGIYYFTNYIQRDLGPYMFAGKENRSLGCVHVDGKCIECYTTQWNRHDKKQTKRINKIWPYPDKEDEEDK